MPRKASELLEGTIETLYCFKNMEAGSFVINVMSLERVNAKNFEDREIVMLEMKKMMFQSRYAWIVAWNSLPVSFFFFFFFLSFALLFLHFRGYLCILRVC
jgi:hypothetical protein